MAELRIDPEDTGFSYLLTAAVKHALDVDTYEPRIIVQWIRKHMDGKMTLRNIAVMYNDINHTEDLGGTENTAIWQDFREWLRDQRRTAMKREM
ncbi:MAG: hypothetical protein IJ523_09780 [Succinivibrionaceae bacterium]|nr:hypothetical protein [Succinivibrionaceae bacterium]